MCIRDRYYTNSVASHVAVFGEDWQLYDSTLNGVIKHHISNYIDDTSYLMLKAAPSEVKANRMKAIEYGESSIGTPYSYKIAFFMFLQIIFGFAPNEFRLRIFFDFAITFYLLSFLHFFFLFILFIYLLVVSTNLMRDSSTIRF